MNTRLLMLAADASVFENMTFAERASEALRVSLLGIGMVFAVLAILWGVLEIFRYFFYDLPNKGKSKEKKPEKPQSSEPAPAPVAVVPAQTDDTELVAAITAALCVVLDKPATGFRVVSFRKTGTR